MLNGLTRQHSWQPHARIQHVTLVFHPLEIYHHTNHHYDHDKPMHVCHQPITHAVATTMATRIPVVQNVIKGR